MTIRNFVLRIALLIAAGLAVTASAGARERVNIDRDWRFAFGYPDDPSRDFGFGGGAFVFAKAGFANGPAAPKFDDRAWRKLDLPHDWAVELPFDQRGSANHGSRAIGRGFPEHNIGWYRKAIAIAESDRGQRIGIEFDGAYRDAVVWINGYRLGSAPSGYSSVHYDLTDYLNYGGRNVISVRVDATDEEGWFYEGAGIYRHVWLTKTDPLHVGHWGTFVTTAVGNDSATVDVQTVLDNEGDATRGFAMEQRIVDAAGRTVATATQPGSVAKRASGTFSAQLRVANPALWGLDQPNLYRMVTTIRDGGRIIDRYETPFGIRTIRFDAKTGFWLNGQNIKLHGTNNHQDHAGIGVALPDAMQAYRLQQLKAFGVNAYRTAHHPPTPELLEAADRLGMLVIDENRIMGTTPEIRDQLDMMILRDRNHPSVILWSVGNEEWAIEGNEIGARLTKVMQDEVHRLDPTRRATVAISGGAPHGSSSTTDVLGFNYRTQNDSDGYHRLFPDTPVLMTEEGSTYATRGVYVADADHVSIPAYDQPARPDGNASSIQQGWAAVAERPWMGGMFVWTGFDYSGETTPFGWPAVSSQFGMLDTTGAMKDSAWYLKSQWTSTPMVHLLPHWNWPDRSGKDIPVWVYSNATEVELFLNGTSLGRKRMKPYGHLEWSVPYAPGKLLAQAYTDGRPVASDAISTTGPARALRAAADRSVIAADGADMAIVTLDARDLQGRAVATAQDEVALHMVGAGRIIGVGNGDPGSHDGVRPADDVTVGAVTGWQIADVDAARAAEAGSIALVDLRWRDPFAYYPPGTGPKPTDRFVLRGTMTLGAEDQDRISTVFLPTLAKMVAVFIDGHEVTASLRHDDGLSLPLAGLSLGSGQHEIALLVRGDGVAALRTLQDVGLNGTNVAWVQALRPARPWRVRLFNGLAQVLVQSTNAKGIAALSARSPGLAPARISVVTKAP